MNDPPTRKHNGGRKPGFGAYPTRERLMTALVPAYLETVAELGGEPAPMKLVVPKLTVSRARLRALRYQWRIPWPPA